MNYCLQKIYYTSIDIFYLLLLFISRSFQKCKNDVNPASTSEVTSKTIFILFYLNCFLFATHLNLMRLKKRD